MVAKKTAAKKTATKKAVATKAASPLQGSDSYPYHRNHHVTTSV